MKSFTIAVTFLACTMGAAAQTATQMNDFDRNWNEAVKATQAAAKITLGAPPGSEVSNAEVRKMTTKLCAGVVSNMLADHQVGTAKKFFDEHKAKGDIDLEASTKLNADISAALDNEFIAADSDKSIGESGDADGLRKAFEHADQTMKEPSMRDRLKNAIWEKWNRNRLLADADYLDTLVKATETWYAGNGDYKKIPQQLWDKLHELDRYQFKHALPGKEVLSSARVAPP